MAVWGSEHDRCKGDEYIIRGQLVFVLDLLLLATRREELSESMGIVQKRVWTKLDPRSTSSDLHKGQISQTVS